MAIDIKDLQLIKKAQQGDEASFEALILSCKARAYSIALRYMKNESDAMDALQESFIKIYRNLDKFKGDSKFDTWVYRIVVNTCKDLLRKNDKYKLNDSLSQEDDDGQRTVDIRDSGLTPEEELEKKELADELLACMEKIPSEHKDVLILRDIQNLSYEEISEIENTSLGTVKSRINRARQNLKKVWLEQKSKENV